jgi:hypothetical protein
MSSFHVAVYCMSSFDHLVGAGEQRLGNVETDRLCGLESGHVTAAPTRSVMSSRRLMSSMGLPPGADFSFSLEVRPVSPSGARPKG